MIMEKEQSGTPLGDILLRIGVELGEAARSVEDLHALVGATVKANGANETFLREAQTIDILQQHLSALGGFISELSESLPESWRVESGDAVSKVTLSKLRQRLAQIRVDESQDQHPAGDCHMF
jgi:hypothetical protein